MIFKKDRMHQSARTEMEADMENEQVYDETQEELDNGNYEPRGEGEEEQPVEVMQAPVRVKPQQPAQPAPAQSAGTTAVTLGNAPPTQVAVPQPARKGRGESDDNRIAIVARIDKELHSKLKIYSMYTQQSIVALIEAWIRQQIPETKVEFTK